MVGFEEIVAHRGLKGLTRLILSIDQNYYTKRSIHFLIFIKS